MDVTEACVADFEIQDKLPDELTGLTPRILFDLFDIAVKWGQPRTDDLVNFTFRDEKTEFAIAASPENKAFMVCKRSDAGGFMTDAGAHLITTKGGQAPIFWGRRVTPEEVKLAIAVIDAQCMHAGLISTDDGRRLPLPDREREEPAKFVVSEIFASEDAVFFVPPGDSPEDWLSQFDEPDKLAVYETPLGGKVIAPKSAADRIAAREETVRQVLAEHGTALEDLGSLSPEEFMALAEEVDRRTKGEEKT